MMIHNYTFLNIIMSIYDINSIYRNINEKIKQWDILKLNNCDKFKKFRLTLNKKMYIIYIYIDDYIFKKRMLIAWIKWK